MLYDRWAIERLAEAIAVAAVVAEHHTLDEHLIRYGGLLRELHALDACHLDHVARYHDRTNGPYSSDGYAADLACIADRANTWLRPTALSARARSDAADGAGGTGPTPLPRWR